MLVIKLELGKLVEYGMFTSWLCRRLMVVPWTKQLLDSNEKSKTDSNVSFNKIYLDSARS